MLDRVDQVPPPGTVEAQDELSVEPLAEGVLELVAVVPLLYRRHDRADGRGLETAEARQRVGHLLLLGGQLHLVGQHLPRRPGVRGARLDAVGAWLQQLGQPRLRERALGLLDGGAHAVAGYDAAHEHHEAGLRAADPGAAVGQ